MADLPSPTSGLFLEVSFRRLLASCEDIVAGTSLARPDLIGNWQQSPVFHHVSAPQAAAAATTPGGVLLLPQSVASARYAACTPACLCSMWIRCRSSCLIWRPRRAAGGCARVPACLHSAHNSRRASAAWPPSCCHDLYPRPAPPVCCPGEQGVAPADAAVWRACGGAGQPAAHAGCAAVLHHGPAAGGPAAAAAAASQLDGSSNGGSVRRCCPRGATAGGSSTAGAGGPHPAAPGQALCSQPAAGAAAAACSNAWGAGGWRPGQAADAAAAPRERCPLAAWRMPLHPTCAALRCTSRRARLPAGLPAFLHPPCPPYVQEDLAEELAGLAAQLKSNTQAIEGRLQDRGQLLDSTETALDTSLQVGGRGGGRGGIAVHTAGDCQQLTTRATAIMHPCIRLLPRLYSPMPAPGVMPCRKRGRARSGRRRSTRRAAPTSASPAS